MRKISMPSVTAFTVFVVIAVILNGSLAALLGQETCAALQSIDCYGHDIGHVANSTSIMTADACCKACESNPQCKVAVLVSQGNGQALCLFKDACPTPSSLKDHLMLCPKNSSACKPPTPPPDTPCPCAKCPCDPSAVLPRTCDSGSVAAGMGFCNTSDSTSNRIADLLSRLTRAEKLYLVAKADTGFLPRLNLKEFQFFNTCLHGWWTTNVTTFPMPIGLAATFDVELMAQIGDVVGLEGRAMSQRDYAASLDWPTNLHGVALNYLVCKDASEVNMARHPLWGRTSETYGEDPYLSGLMGEAFTKALQRPDPSTNYLRTAAVTRHLVVYSGPESLKDDGTQGADRFAFNANVSARDLEDYFYPPFEACISRDRGGSIGAMCSDAAQNGVPSCASELLMTTKPGEWNATDDFFVVSDMGSYYNVFARHNYGANMSDALYGDFQAGLDILYIRGSSRCRGGQGAPAIRQGNPPGCAQVASDSDQSNETLAAMDAATNGTVNDARFTLEDLDAKAARVLQLRFALGEFDPVEKNPYAQAINASVIDSEAHRAFNRNVTAASIVLVKNDAELLPLTSTAKVAVIGPWARPANQASLASAHPYVHAYAGSSAEMIDILAGITTALQAVPTYAQGCETNQTIVSDPTFSEAKRVAAAADVTIVALGLTANVEDQHGVGLEAEMRDRLSLELPQVQQDLLAAVRQSAKKVVLVIVAGSGVPFNESNADAAVYAMYGGAQAGSGLADVLFGAVPPTGRLPLTVFTELSQMKPMGNYDLTTQPGRTYLFYDPEQFGQPQFWFGYGLGYSRFEYSDLTVTAVDKCNVHAVLTVTNVGKVVSREVAQLYLGRPAEPSVPVAKWALRGIQRTSELAPGSAATLQFTIDAKGLSTVMEDGTRKVSAGSYTIAVGGGSPVDPRGSAKVIQSSVSLGGSCSV